MHLWQVLKNWQRNILHQVPAYQTVNAVFTSFPLSVIEETWREVALAQLTSLIDLTFLDGVLAPEKPNKRQQQHHNLIISNIVAKNWHLPVTQSLLNLNEVGLREEQETVIQTAIACIECLPKGEPLAVLNLCLKVSHCLRWVCS